MIANKAIKNNFDSDKLKGCDLLGENCIPYNVISIIKGIIWTLCLTLNENPLKTKCKINIAITPSAKKS